MNRSRATGVLRTGLFLLVVPVLAVLSGRATEPEDSASTPRHEGAGWLRAPVAGERASTGNSESSYANDPPLLGDNASLIAYPLDMAEQVEFSDVIVAGTVLASDYRGYFQGYGDQGQLMLAGTPSTDSHVPPLMMMELTEFTIRADTVYRSDGQVVAGQTFVLRMEGSHANDPCAEGGDLEFWKPLSQIGEERLLFLGREPDGLAYGLLNGAASRLIIEEPEVMETWCTPRPVMFTTNTAPAAFMAELASLLGQ